MGSSVKKTPSKNGHSPAKDRRSASKAIKEENASASSSKNARSPINATPKSASFTHALPTPTQRKGNGRVSGRNLIMWSRPRMAEKLLLHMYYECTRHKVQLPWDAIAHRLHPGSSGAAVVQHINRLRRDIIAEGHLVPPVPQKPSSNTTVDPSIRGYVREFVDGDDQETVRAVRYDEHLEDAKFNLPSFDMHSEGPQDTEEAMSVDSPSEFEAPDSPSPRERRNRFSSRGRYARTPTSAAAREAPSPAPERNLRENPFYQPSDGSVPSAGRPHSQPYPEHCVAPPPGTFFYQGSQQAHPYDDESMYPRVPPMYALGYGGYMPYPMGYPVHPTAWQHMGARERSPDRSEREPENPILERAKSPEHSQNEAPKAETAGSSEADQAEKPDSVVKVESPASSEPFPEPTVSTSEVLVGETDVDGLGNDTFGNAEGHIIDSFEAFLGGDLQEFVVDPDEGLFTAQLHGEQEDAFLPGWANIPDLLV